MEAVFDQNSIARINIERTEGVFGDKIGFFAKVFGCWHKNMGRPVTSRTGSYRACQDCGARKQFNPKTLETYGEFYFPPTISQSNDRR